MSHVDFDNIYHGESSDLGKLRFTAGGFGWKSYKEENNQPVTFSGSTIRAASWLRVARNFQLRFNMRNSELPRTTFDGFKRDDLDKIKRTVDEFFQIKVEVREGSLKGYNWGAAEVKESDIIFTIHSKPTFELPLSRIANSNIAGKNEVSLEFTPAASGSGSGAANGGENLGPGHRPADELVEMRFYVPGKNRRPADKDGEDGEEANGDGDEEMVTDLDEEGNEVSAAEAFHKSITDRADLGDVAGETLVAFEEVLVLTPRGRYSLECYLDSLRLIGKSTDYRILYQSIHRIFMLPKGDEMFCQVVLGLDPPIRQGATRYPFLVMQFPKEEETEVQLELTDEVKQRYPDLSDHYDGPTFQVIPRILKVFTGKKVVAPTTFRSAQGQYSIKANVKANQGELYFLEKCMLFIAKQPILIDYSKTDSIAFSRVGSGLGASRSFDLKISSKISAGADNTFSLIPKEEADPIEAYLREKGVRLKNQLEEENGMAVDLDLDESEEEAMDSEDERPAKGAAKGAGASKGERRKSGRDAEDDDESDDESFAEDSGSDSGGSGGSEDESDFSGSEASDASDQMMDEIRKRADAKRPKHKNDSGSEDGGEGEGKGDKPKKKKAKTKKDEE